MAAFITLIRGQSGFFPSSNIIMSCFGFTRKEWACIQNPNPWELHPWLSFCKLQKVCLIMLLPKYLASWSSFEQILESLIFQYYLSEINKIWIFPRDLDIKNTISLKKLFYLKQFLVYSPNKTYFVILTGHLYTAIISWV